MESKRLRPHSAARFSESQHRFSLKESLETLRGEAHAGVGGHRQMTIFHRAPVTMVLFAFDANGELSDHAANGLVTIQALDGCVLVAAEERNYELRAGEVLVLSPNVRHSVRAQIASGMLLTVCLEGDN